MWHFCCHQKSETDTKVRCWAATAGIRADGKITPCILMPNEVGDLRTDPFCEIWDNSPELLALRDREQLKLGNCGSCRFKLVCGGCRAAAMAIHGNPMAGDPSCWLFPELAGPIQTNTPLSCTA
jgi:radical SAM protein with 4Fe4S-binding SPASM domain